LALATRILVGVQPVLTQMPPNSVRSTIATFIPASPRAVGKERPGLACADDDCVEAAAHGADLWLRVLFTDGRADHLIDGNALTIGQSTKLAMQ